MSPVDRRAFLSRTLRATVAVGATPYLFQQSTAAATVSEPGIERFCAFSESFQSWPIPKVCDKFAEIGLNGVDLTVRPGGHIDPNEAVQKLPVAADAAKNSGIGILMLTTAIKDADPTAERILAICGELGIDRIKLGYFRYDQFGNLRGQMDEARTQIGRVAKLAHKHNVLPCVHIHSGSTIPNSGATSFLLLKDFKPGEVGAYVDPMHMTVEGGLDGWRQGLDLLAPWIALSSMKNSIWVSDGRDSLGQARWSMKKCPVADGMAPIPDFIAALGQLGYRDLFTFGSEYDDGNSWKKLTVDECLVQTKADLDYVKGLMKS